jgi:hypothetical protein
MTSSEQPKLIYIAQRHPRCAPGEFTHRWRQHAALGMSQPRWSNVARYLHCDRVEGPLPGVPTTECDGVAIVAYRSEAHRRAHIATEEARRTMKADELHTFAQPVSQTSLLTQEQIVCLAISETFRLFVFWTSDSPQFEFAWDAAAIRWRGSLARDVGLLRNKPSGAPGEFRCAGIDELMASKPEPLCELARRWEHGSQLPGVASMILTRSGMTRPHCDVHGVYRYHATISLCRP